MVASLTTPFRARHPNVRFRIVSCTSIEVLGLLENLEVDAGLTYLDNEPLGKVRSVPLYDESYRLITAPDSQFGDRDQVTWKEVGEVPLCLLTPDMQNRRIIDRALLEAGTQAKPSLTSNSVIVLYTHVKTGRWASVMPAKLADTLGLSDAVRAIPIVDPLVTYRVGLVVPLREPMTPMVAALVQTARAVAPTLAGLTIHLKPLIDTVSLSPDGTALLIFGTILVLIGSDRTSYPRRQFPALHEPTCCSKPRSSRALLEAGTEAKPSLTSNSIIVLYTHVKTGRWASVMPAKLADTLGLSDAVRSIPIVDPKVTYRIGLCSAARSDDADGRGLGSHRARSRADAGRLSAVTLRDSFRIRIDRFRFLIDTAFPIAARDGFIDLWSDSRSDRRWSVCEGMTAAPALLSPEFVLGIWYASGLEFVQNEMRE